MAKKILITGARGFLGSIICDRLKISGCHLKSLGRKAENDFAVDLADENLNFKLSEGFDTVIHAAGKAHSVPKTQEEKQEFYNVNFEGTKRLCNLLKVSSLPKSFIFISTVAVYGAEEGALISEEHALNGTSPYARSKIMAEKWLQHWASENDVVLSILRLPLLAGPNPPGNLGAMIRGIRSGKYLSIGDASEKKSILLAEDIPPIIPRLEKTGGIYNLTDGNHPSFRELENVISAATGKKRPFKISLPVAKMIALIGDLAGNKAPLNSDKLKKITSTLTFDDSRAREILGWQSTPVIEKMPYLI